MLTRGPLSMSREYRLLLTEKQDTIAALHSELAAMKVRHDEEIAQQQSSSSTGGVSASASSGAAADSPHEDLQQLLVAQRDVARLTSELARTRAGVSSSFLFCLHFFLFLSGD
jgi:hypothetical protein